MVPIRRAAASRAAVAVLVVMTLLSGVHGAAPWSSSAAETGVPVNKEWEVTLPHPTSLGPDDAARIGRAARSGDLYFTTDVTGALWAINTSATTTTRSDNSSRVAWSYNDWPPLPHEAARTRQISAGPAHVVVLRNGTAYALNSATGTRVWSRPVTAAQVAQGGLWVFAAQVLIAGADNFEMWNASSGRLLWRFDDLWTPSYGAIAVSHDGAARVAALRRRHRRRPNGSNKYALDERQGDDDGDGDEVSVVLLDRADGHVVAEFPLPKNVTLGAQPQIFQLTADYILLYTATGIYRHGLNAATPSWSSRVSFTPQGYGLGSPYIYLRTATSLYSYDLGTGRAVSSINLTATFGPSFQYVRHLWGFDSFASLGMIFADPPPRTNGTAPAAAVKMCVVGIDAANMTVRYLVAPPTAATLNDYGNAVDVGTIVIPSRDGAAIIDRSGAVGTIAGCAVAVPASVEVGEHSVTLTDYRGVKQYAFNPSQGLIEPRPHS